jgi:hypothetical protein
MSANITAMSLAIIVSMPLNMLILPGIVKSVTLGQDPSPMATFNASAEGN